MKRRPRAWKWIGRGFVALIMVIAVGGAAGYLWLRTSLPQIAGTLELHGVTAPAEIRRDRHGVVHIRAETDDDAYFALGFAHAQDRLFQMEFMRRLGAGRLSELVGRPTVALDRRMRVFGLYRLAQTSYEHLAPGPRASLKAYAKGVNAYIETHPGVLAPELAFLGGTPEPWQPADSLVWARIMAMRLSANLWSEGLRARLAERLDPDRIDAFWPEVGAQRVAPTLGAAETRQARTLLAGMMRSWPDALAPVTASNFWIVAGRHTETGKPILANDPHLGFRAPGLWYLARIETPTLSVTGATVPGVPMTILGHNGTIAWGFTTTGSDTQDLFLEKLDPSEPGRYLSPDGPRPFAVRSETIVVRGAAPITVTIRSTRHGPVVSDLDPEARRLAGPGHVVALAATALRPDDRTAGALWRLNRAKSWDGFIEAMRDFHAPQQNISYADVDGNIGFIAPGRVPIRRAGKGLSPAPGWTGSHDWTGLIPFEALPRAFNPANGRIVNANHPVVGPDYPYDLGIGGTPPYRALRIHAMIDEGGSASPEKAGAMQNDTVSLAARELLPLMMKMTPRGEPAAQALALLRDWDGRMAADRPEPLIFTAWLGMLNRLLYADETGPLFRQMWRLRPIFVRNVLRGDRAWCDDTATEPRETCPERLAAALDQALADLAETHGEDIERWRWGKAHYAHFRHPMLGWIPVLNRIGDIRVPASGGAFTVNRAQNRISDRRNPYASVHGAGYRAVYDLANLDRSLFMVATGQSGNPLSGHYRDLTPLWAAGRYFGIPPMTAKAVSDASTPLRLIPRPR